MKTCILVSIPYRDDKNGLTTKYAASFVYLFQSLIGTIKTIIRFSVKQNKIIVSIPYRDDKNKKRELELKERELERFTPL